MNYRLVGLFIAALLAFSTLSPAGVTVPASTPNDKGKEEADDADAKPVRYTPIGVQDNCPEKYWSIARGFAEAVQKGDVEYMKQFLQNQSPEVIACVFGRVFRFLDPRWDASVRVFASPFHIAAVWEQVDVLRLLLGYVITHPELATEFLARLFDAQGRDLLRVPAEAALLGHTDVVRVLLEFADAAPDLAAPLFAHQPPEFTTLENALIGNHPEIVRLLRDFAAIHPELVWHLFGENNLDDEKAQPLPYAMAKGYVEIVRILLASPWSERLQKNLRSFYLPKDPVLRIAIWTAIVEHRPDLAGWREGGVEEEELINIGWAEAAVMARHIAGLKRLLEDGLIIDDVLLTAMLQNARHFDREAFKRFLQELEILRDPCLELRAQTMFARFLGTELPMVAPAPPVYEEELRRIILILRERLDGNAATMAIESYVNGVRNIGRYGLPNQFAHEDAARDALMRITTINLAEARIPPGVRLFTNTVVALLTMIYLEKFGTMPRK